jgi:hypothetical protein
MRLARLVAAGLVLGALVGFLSALVRPRSVSGAAPAGPVDPTTRSDRATGAPVAGRHRSDMPVPERPAAPVMGPESHAEQPDVELDVVPLPAFAGLPGDC